MCEITATAACDLLTASCTFIYGRVLRLRVTTISFTDIRQNRRFPSRSDCKTGTVDCLIELSLKALWLTIRYPRSLINILIAGKICYLLHRGCCVFWISPFVSKIAQKVVYHAVCLFTSQHLLVLIAPTHGGMARLSWPGWLVTHQDGSPICWRSPIQVLTGPGVD